MSLAAITLCGAILTALPQQVSVTDIRAVHRNGQIFVTWKDAAEGEAGAKFRYSLYRSEKPITQDNLADAELCFSGVLNNSAKLFGTAFRQADRLDPSKPTCVLEEGGKPLPMWSGLAVHTTRAEGRGYYAVVATDEELRPVSVVEPGKSATVEPLEERVGPIEPIKLQDAKDRGGHISGRKGLPLHVVLHAADSAGGGAAGNGDYYLCFGNETMGYRDGLAGVFCVSEYDRLTLRSMLSCGLPGAFDKNLRGPDGFKGLDHIALHMRDAVEHPSGNGSLQTFWFGYYCVPQWAKDQIWRAYPFTEERLLWMIEWVSRRYGVDLNRRYCSGGSMGAWGTTSFAFRGPEIFAAEHRGDLPFYGWCCGRRDGFATWKEQLDMVKAMTASRHGFAFAWNDGTHQTGAKPMQEILRYYPPERFALNLSYPAFGNSSINSNPGNGDPADGDKEGGINRGFAWTDPVDEPGRWSINLSNALAKAEMTVDVTPRRCQKFKPKPGERLKWTNSAGGSGEVVADDWGLVTVFGVKVPAGQTTTLSLER